MTEATTVGETPFPKKPFIAGFWLISALPITLLVVQIFENWVHRQDLSDTVGMVSIMLVFGGTAYMWAIKLVRRSGRETNWKIGLGGGLGFVLGMLVGYGGYDLVFGSVMKLLGIQQTVRGTHPEFLVVFILWTGIITGMSGLGLGLGFKKPELALKLFGTGLVSGAVIFAIVAFVMDLVGFHVGSSRPDGLPSMPIITVIGIWSAALVGSEIFGRILAKEPTEN